MLIQFLASNHMRRLMGRKLSINGSSRAPPPRTEVHTHTHSLSRARALSLFSMGTVRADTALFGQPLLVISACLYSQVWLLTLTHRALTVMKIMCVSVSQVYMPSENWGPILPPPMSASRKGRPGRQQDKRSWLY